MTALTCVGYVRVSGMGQISGDGFHRQGEAIDKYAQRHGLTLMAIFRDGGVSGTRELDDRDGLAALMEHIQAEGIKLVLVEKADRLARDLLVGEVILAQFRKLGVTVIAADSGTDLTVTDDDPTRVMIRQILGVIAQFDKAMTVRRLRDARSRKRRAGQRCEGRLPFGSYPGEADALERILALHKAGKQPGAIAEALNVAGVPTRSGKPWIRQVVGPIIRRAEDEKNRQVSAEEKPALQISHR
jgi:DNA invertase Pin-like site-specific DNA recombinase